MDVILKLINISEDTFLSFDMFFHFTLIQFSMILLLQQVLSSQVPQFQKEGCAYYIDRIFLNSLIYMCKMKNFLCSGLCQIKQIEILIIK